MAAASPPVHTYHCICSSLLLASTHTLSSLPRRAGLDKALILPLPSQPPVAISDTRSLSPSPDAPDVEANDSRDAKPVVESPRDMPPSGYSTILHMNADKKAAIVRREDGFEKRVLWRCGRCKLVVGYQLLSEGGEPIDVDSSTGDGVDKGEKDLKVIYLLPGGLISTNALAEKGLKIRDEDVEIPNGKLAWE